MVRMRKEQIARLGRLLYMRYRPSELADEIGCHVSTVYRSFIPAGCPHERDDYGHIWIVGTEFAEWARIATKRKSASLGEDEAYCLRCRKPVAITGDITVTPSSRYLELVTGECPECGCTVNRARARKNATSARRNRR